MRLILPIFIALISLNISLFAVTESELERAYAKEFAYLKAQKSMLSKRLKSVKSTQGKKLSIAKNDLEKLQNIVLQKNEESERLSDNLYRARASSQIVVDDTALIESVVMQSTTALKAYDINVLVDTNNYQKSIKEIFVKSDALIYDLSSLKTINGEFYAADGSQKNGTIVKVGNIASYGISNDIAAALVPAGEGKLKVYKSADASQSATDLQNRDLSKPLNIFIYENSSTEIEDIKEKTIYSVIDSGGIIGWIIVAIGLVGLLLGLLRSKFLISASSSTEDLANSALEKLLKSGKDGALEYLKEKKGSTVRVLKATIRNLDRDREHIEDIVAESILHESGRLDKYGSAILVIAAVSPLLGLLGTVTGMIATFDIITEFGTGDPKLLSGGISIALVTTELGLIVAIPILMIGNLLGGWAERVKDNMEHSALHIINEYNKQK